MKIEEEIKEMEEFVCKSLARYHNKLLKTHSRALACHCECLGMNAENSWAICAGKTPPFSDLHYKEILEKWGIMNEKGEPII